MCEYCEFMVVEDEDKDGDYILFHGKPFTSEVKECDCSMRLMCCGSISDKSDREWFVEFTVDDDWDVEVPITVGRGFMATPTVICKVPDGFECDEWFKVKYCPNCGRGLE